MFTAIGLAVSTLIYVTYSRFAKESEKRLRFSKLLAVFSAVVPGGFWILFALGEMSGAENWQRWRWLIYVIPALVVFISILALRARSIFPVIAKILVAIQIPLVIYLFINTSFVNSYGPVA